MRQREKVRFAFALDCCDREAMGPVATTGGITAEDVQDLMVATVEHRYGPVNRLPEPIEWLSDNGGCYTARDTHALPQVDVLQTFTQAYTVGAPIFTKNTNLSKRFSLSRRSVTLFLE